MNDTFLAEVLVGRVFVILGCKNSEMPESEWRYRARAVFQGNNIQTGSGKSVYEIFEDVSNTPASLLAARSAFAVALMRGFSAMYRDAYQAFLQALFESRPGVVNLVEIPRDWWPQEWFHDMARRG